MHRKGGHGPVEDRVRDWGNVATSQEHWETPEADRGREGSPPETA